MRETQLDWRRISQRLDVVVAALSACCVADGFKLDKEAALRAVLYCRSRAAGGRENRAEEAFLTEWLTNNGIPHDFVLRGDIGSMIAALAAHHHRRAPHVVDNLQSRVTDLERRVSDFEARQQGR